MSRTVKSKAKSKNKSSLKVLIAAIVALVVACVLITVAILQNKSHIVTLPGQSDSEKFATEYTQVPENNPYTYRTGQEIIDILQHGTGVVFLGFPSCPWCQAYAPMLSEVASEQGIEKIFYHNTYDDWQNNTPEYQKITEILADYLQYDDEGKKHLYVPNVAFVKDGKIIGVDWETSKDTAGAKTPEEYWTAEKVAALKARLAEYMQQIKGDDCATTCDK